MLKPGGTLFFAGEPSRQGDKLAARPQAGGGQGRAAVAPRDEGPPRAEHHGARRGRARARGRRRRPRVRPGRPRRHAAARGFADVQVRGEELLANWFGWFNRTLEASAEPKDVPLGWIQYAYKGYILLQRVDRSLLEPRLPPRIFYNLMLAARKPA